MKKSVTIAIMFSGLILTACGGPAGDGNNNRQDTTVDRGVDANDLTQMEASVWVDPFGCEHWYIDDGVEGYLSARLNRDGTPRCDPSRSSSSVRLPGQ